MSGKKPVKTRMKFVREIPGELMLLALKLDDDLHVTVEMPTEKGVRLVGMYPAAKLLQAGTVMKQLIEERDMLRSALAVVVGFSSHKELAAMRATMCLLPEAKGRLEEVLPPIDALLATEE